MNQTFKLLPEEKLNYTLRAIYEESGYSRYRMNKFEEYDLYADHRDFLAADGVITFTDLSGKLMALKPDVTLSIVKNTRDLKGKTERLYYNENVYRAAKGRDTFREIPQTGLELLGCVTDETRQEVLNLALRTLSVIPKKSVLEISHLGILQDLLASLGVPESAEKELIGLIGGRNRHELEKRLEALGIGTEKRALFLEIVAFRAPAPEAARELSSLFGGLSSEEHLREFAALLRALPEEEAGDPEAYVDFSVVDDISYYDGVVFKGFLDGVPEPVLSGGAYDALMRKMGRTSSAIGFALYVNLLTDHNVFSETAKKLGEERRMLNVALPKGRLGEKVYQAFREAGFPCDEVLSDSRKLIFENPEAGVRYFWVKPSDVAIYVERGAADVGVAGKDILLEYAPDVFELLDLGLGKCRMCVAGKKDFADDTRKSLRVATKFGRIAADYYRSIGRDIDIIHLNGSIEIAPILGLSDVIVDIVETGTTLKENNLEVLEEIVPISARLIANKASYPFKAEQIAALTKRLSER